MSWALIAHGIDRGCFLAASSDINDIIADDDLADQLAIFPDSSLDAGIYLWSGSVKVDEDGILECIGAASRVELEQIDDLLRYDGREDVPV